MKKIKANPKDKKKPFDYGYPQDLVKLPPSRTASETWYASHPISEWETPEMNNDHI